MLPQPRIQPGKSLNSHLREKLIIPDQTIAAYPSTEDFFSSGHQFRSSNEPRTSASWGKLPLPISCSDCGATFKKLQGLNKHRGKVHPTEPRLNQCAHCEKKFRNKYALKYHVLQVHEEGTRMACIVCSKVFYNQYTLTKHQRRAHPEFLVALRLTITQLL